MSGREGNGEGGSEGLELGLTSVIVPVDLMVTDWSGSEQASVMELVTASMARNDIRADARRLFNVDLLLLYI
jgi:hypothetical protein